MSPILHLSILRVPNRRVSPISAGDVVDVAECETEGDAGAVGWCGINVSTVIVTWRKKTINFRRNGRGVKLTKCFGRRRADCSDCSAHCREREDDESWCRDFREKGVKKGNVFKERGSKEESAWTYYPYPPIQDNRHLQSNLCCPWPG